MVVTSQVVLEVKNPPANKCRRGKRQGRGSLIPGLGRSPGVGNDTPLQYSCLGNSTGYSGAAKSRM